MARERHRVAGKKTNQKVRFTSVRHVTIMLNLTVKLKASQIMLAEMKYLFLLSLQIKKGRLLHPKIEICIQAAGRVQKATSSEAPGDKKYDIHKPVRT